jgi:hypothetical protein
VPIRTTKGRNGKKFETHEKGSLREDNSPEIYPYSGSGESKRRRLLSRPIFWLGAAIAVLILGFGASLMFSSATVSVMPSQSLVQAESESFTANKESSEGLSFEIVETEGDGKEVVPATGEERKEVKSSGQIVIYNDYDSNDQRLIKNTRFETPEGLIYRIDESVVVPGRVERNGSNVPGSVEVTVYADEPGEKHNIGLKDFTIPGFRSDPGRFEKMYARSQTEMKGGFVGMVKIVQETDALTSRKRIRETLQADLQNKIRSQIPDNFVLFDEGLIFEFEELPQSEARGDSVTINERVKLYGILLKKDSLANALAQRLDPEFSEDDIDVANWNDVDFVIVGKGDFEPERDLELDFEINGNINLMLTFDAEQLKFDLAGKPKKRLRTVLSGYSSIDRAEASVSPPWKRSFPKNTDDIKIEHIISES